VNKKLDKLLQQSPLIWRGCGAGQYSKYKQNNGLGTGYHKLDEILPEQGWPQATVIEVISQYSGIGEIQLFLPAMAKLTAQKKNIIWIAPPFIPYAPALLQAGLDLDYVLVLGTRSLDRNNLWAMEKVLHVSACGLVLCWPGRLNIRLVRRLQLAAEKGNSIGVLFSHMNLPATPADMKNPPKSFRHEHQYGSLPVALRLAIQPVLPVTGWTSTLQVSIVKARGASRFHSIKLDLV